MDQVEEVKQRLDVAEVIGGYVQLKQSGRNLKAPCPFHHEKTASFMVSPEKQIWHCFGCGEGGDIIKFVMKIEGLEFREALEKLAQRAGIELTGRSRKDDHQKARLLEVTELAVRYYQASLLKNKTALEYMKKRGLGRQSLIDFRIGYAPNSWEALTKFLQKKGFTDAELQKAGLAGRKRGVYDLFRARLMLPICDAQGRPVGFTGRVLDGSEPKYLNTPQTPLYDKGRVIYGLHLAREAIRLNDEAVVVEGNMDVIASHSAGVKQTVAVSGTALTLDQLKTLGRLTKNIKFAFDADAAGLKATERAIELGQKLGLNLQMVTFDAKDPDELISRDPEAWKSAVANAIYIVDYLFWRFEQDYDLNSAIGKRQFSDRLSQTLRRLADPIEQDHYVKLLADKTGVSSDAVRRKIEQGETGRVAAQPDEIGEKPRRDGLSALEESILAVGLVYPETRLSLNDLSAEDFTSENRRRIHEALLAAEDASSEEIASLPSLKELSDYVKILSLRGEAEFSELAPADRSFESFMLVRRLRIEANNKTKNELSKQLREAEKSGNTDLARSLLERYQAIITKEI